MDRIATPEDLKRWDEDAAAAAPTGGFESPELPDQVGTDVAFEDGQYVINRAQDVEPILDYCKERAAAGAGWSASGDMLEAAHFPAVIVERYCVQTGITFQQFMADPGHVKAMMVDPALRHFLVYANNPHKTFR